MSRKELTQVHIEVVRVPDLGGAEEVEVIELAVAVGDTVEVEQTLLVLESEKATMELPSPVAGVVRKILVAEGHKIEREGLPLMEIEVSAALPAGGSADAASPPAAESRAPAAAQAAPRPATGKSAAQHRQAAPARAERVAREPGAGGEGRATPPRPPAADPGGETPAAEPPAEAGGAAVYAGPLVRKLARELGVELAQVQGSGPRRRILNEDVQAFVRAHLQRPAAGEVRAVGGIPAVPAVDYGRFGPVSGGELSRIGRLTASNMHRSWLNAPHVTQFDSADVTELEAFRRGQASDAQERGVKLTPVPFILKACAAALRDHPVLNRALGGDGTSYVQREYFHIGMAVDTERGLLVPVVRDVDRKGIWELAAEIAALAERARAGKLRMDEMQGACFTLSSLGAIGGEGFTPIINVPEVAILGVSRSAVRPVWNGSEFVPRTLLPVSLSYDHRLVNGADGGRFLTRVVALLGDIRGLLL